MSDPETPEPNAFVHNTVAKASGPSRPPASGPIGGSSVQLLDADVLTDFRAALATFEDEAQAVLDSVSAKANATQRWLDEEAPLYWANSSRKASDSIASARIALEMCRLRTVAGHRSSCIEEKKALARAKDREEFCQTQRAKVRSASVDLRHEVDEMLGRLAQLQRWLDGDLPKLQARLHRTAKAVEAYASTPPVRAATQPVAPANPEPGRPKSEESSP